MSAGLITIEVSKPGDPYTLFTSGRVLDVHLAGPTAWRYRPVLVRVRPVRQQRWVQRRRRRHRPRLPPQRLR